MNTLDLHQLDRLYVKHELDLGSALHVWKKANLSESDIRKQVHHDTGVTLSDAELNLLRFAVINCDSPENAPNNSLDEDEIKESCVKLTPKVRESMNRVGMNLFRSKTAGTSWKIVLKDNIPHLARIDDDNEVKTADI